MNTLSRIIISISVFLFTGASLAQEPSEPFSFALIGDLPYGVGIGKKSRQFDALVQQVNEDKSIQWVIHVGDIKRGSTSCKDEFLLDRQKRFARFSPIFILTPGDNEWTDCHRFKAGGFDPLERLAKLREIFFEQENTRLKDATPIYQRQSDIDENFSIFSENIFWKYGDVVFSTVHMVGSNNGYNKFSAFSKAKRSKKHDEEVSVRTNAALSWVDHTFTQAKQDNAKGVFLITHANPGLANYMSDKEKAVFASFLQRIYQHTADFDGQVILSHGDSHSFKIDKPAVYQGKKLQNLTRVETFGALNGHWIKVDVDGNSNEVFTFTPKENH